MDSRANDMIYITWAKFDCFDGSLSVGICALNWRLRVTERASFANFDKPMAKWNKQNEQWKWKKKCFINFCADATSVSGNKN